MKTIRWIAFVLIVVMLTGCGAPASPVATEAPTEATVPTETTIPTEPPTEPTVPETTGPEVTEAPTEPEETEPPETEPPVPLEELRDYNFAKIADYIPNIVQELAYATENNFTGKVIYNFTDAYLRCGTLKKLMKAQEILNQQGLGLKIWDGFRPVSAQAKLYECWPDPNYVSHPLYGGRPHCRGNAVDLTLIDLETGEELDMPTGFDDFTALADRNYSDCTQTQANNSKVLEQAMIAAGFLPYSAEWWHYTDYATYAVDTCFDPAAVSTWEVQAEQSTILYATASPDGIPLIRIQNGEQVTLLGWDYSYAYVNYRGFHGYVESAQIKQVQYPHITIVAPTDTYSYDRMMQDLTALVTTYPDALSLGSIGSSEEGRDLPVILLGDPDATHHVLIQGTVHAKEHMCSWLLMSLTEYHAARSGMEDVCFHIIPMMNPDGVIVSQTGILNEEQQAIYQSDMSRGYTYDSSEKYAKTWKANAKGIDINRNFDAGWVQTKSRYAPSSMLYKGTQPFDCAEAIALRDYTLAHNFDATVSYHAMGCVIYWEYGSKKDVNQVSNSLAQALNAVTGYTLNSNAGLDAAGYKDWAMEALGIPSVTLEIGCGQVPLAENELYSILGRNLEVLPAIAAWVKGQ